MDRSIPLQPSSTERPAPTPQRRAEHAEPTDPPPQASTRRASSPPHRAGPLARRRPRVLPRHYAAYLLIRATHRRQRAARRTWIRLAWVGALLWLLVIISMLAAAVSAAAAYYQVELPALRSMERSVASRDSVRIYDRHGVLLYQINRDGAQHSIPLAQVPLAVVNATIAAEDHDFWINQGVDFQAIARAAYADATAGRLQEGASTITQQLIKQNVLTSDPTFTRKINEAILAIGMTTQGLFSKSQILQMYLNSIPYGPTTYGIDAAATAYFSYTDDPASGETAAQRLDLAQASLLAGIPQSPAYNDPLAGAAGLAHARTRQRIVLDAMVRQGYITQAQAASAWGEAGQPGFLHPYEHNPDLAPHFVDYIQQLLRDMARSGQLPIGQHSLGRSGLDVYTTLDLDLQSHAQQSMLDHLCGNDLNDYPGSIFFGKRYIRQDNVTNAAVVVADQHTGAIRVLLGSLDYFGATTCHPGVNGQFDVATQGYRQPGSSFKPIVYATSFQKGWSPATIVHNEPTLFWDGTKPYRPHDADTHHMAPNMTVRNALQLSQNIPAIETTQFDGVQTLARNAQLWGIHTWLGSWGLSSGIGSLDVRLIDMVQVYTVFANYGLYVPLHAIDRITDSSGQVVYQYQQPAPARVLDPRVAFLLTSVLSDNPARMPEFNVCSPMYLDPSPADCYAHHGNSPNVWPAAAKTGTADDLTNDWTMGYTMDYTTGVWVGNNDLDRKSTRLNSSHYSRSRMPSSA